MQPKVNWDMMGIFTSIACAIHCALLPVFLSSLPVFGINIIHNAVFEWSMIGLALLVGAYALLHGYVKHHQSLLPIFIFGAGFSLLMLKQFYHAAEYWLLAAAVVLIIGAHFYNYRLCNQSKCSSPHHKH